MREAAQKAAADVEKNAKALQVALAQALQEKQTIERKHEELERTRDSLGTRVKELTGQIGELRRVTEEDREGDKGTIAELRSQCQVGTRMFPTFCGVLCF